MKNLKDSLTTAAGVLIAIGGLLLSLSTAGIVLPTWCKTLSVALPIIGGAIIGYFSGKNPNGSVKTPEQIAAQNPPKA